MGSKASSIDIETPESKPPVVIGSAEDKMVRTRLKRPSNEDTIARVECVSLLHMLFNSKAKGTAKMRKSA